MVDKPKEKQGNDYNKNQGSDYLYEEVRRTVFLA